MYCSFNGWCLVYLPRIYIQVVYCAVCYVMHWVPLGTLYCWISVITPYLLCSCPRWWAFHPARHWRVTWKHEKQQHDRRLTCWRSTSSKVHAPGSFKAMRACHLTDYCTTLSDRLLVLCLKAFSSSVSSLLLISLQRPLFSLSRWTSPHPGKPL